MTGFAAVGDAWACTNPSVARGLSIGMLHAQQLRAVIRAHLDDPPALARGWDERTQQAVAPFVHDQIAADRVRIAEMDALRDGLPPPAPAQPMARFQAAAAVDLDIFRNLIETVGCTALPREVLTRPAVQQAMERADPAPPPIPGPDRDTLLQLLAA